MGRVLILVKGLGRGGAEQLLASAAPYLDRQRFAYTYAYLLPWKDSLVKDLEAAGFPVRCLGGGRGAGWVGRLRDLVAEERFDLVHAHSPVAAAAARLVIGGRTRMVYTEHNVWQRYHPATRWANLLTFPRNDHVFAVSDEVRASIRCPPPLRWLRGWRLPPLETLHHGLDPAAVDRWQAAGGPDPREVLGVPARAPVVGSIANFKAAKDHATLLRAAALVRERLPEARFVLVGRGPLEAAARRLAAELGLERTVVFAGFREDAQRLAAAFDVFALSSTYEGLPIALVEAMALGCPAVATRVGGVPEVVAHGRHGLLVPPADPRALAAALLELLGDPGRRARMGEAARARALDFDIRTAVRRMEAVYARLLG